MRNFKELLGQKIIYKETGHVFIPIEIELNSSGYYSKSVRLLVTPDNLPEDEIDDIRGYAFDESFDVYFEVLPQEKITKWKEEFK